MAYSLSDVTAKLLPKGATASKATSDASGNDIEKTYIKTVNGVTPVNGNVTVEIPEVDTSSLVIKNGNRGSLSGYEVPNVTTNALTINQNTTDSNQVTGAVAVTVEQGVEGTSWTKTVSLTNASATIVLGDAWIWSGDEVPTVSENAVLVLHWCNDIGIVNLIEGGTYIRPQTGTVTSDSTSLRDFYIQRDGVTIYSIAPGESLTCSLLPEDVFISSDPDRGYYVGNTSKDANGISLSGYGYSTKVVTVESGFSITIFVYMTDEPI